jgi:hypothetical protein
VRNNRDVIVWRPCHNARVAQVAEGFQEEAGEQAHADAQLQHKDVAFQSARLVDGEGGGEGDMGGVPGEGAVVVDDLGDGGGIAEEGAASALVQVALAEVPLDAVGQGAVVLDEDAVRLRLGQNRVGQGEAGDSAFQGGFRVNVS